MEDDRISDGIAEEGLEGRVAHVEQPGGVHHVDGTEEQGEALLQKKCKRQQSSEKWLDRF